MGQINQTLSDDRIILTGHIKFQHLLTAGMSGPTQWAPHERDLPALIIPKDSCQTNKREYTLESGRVRA
jgi:hypothetical protein